MVRALACLPFLLLSLTTTAHASTSWSLKGVTFSDGGAALGFFTFNSPLNTVTDWQISVFGGDTSTFPPITYGRDNSFVIPRTDGPGFRFRIGLPGKQRDLEFMLAAPLPAGGYVTVPIVPGVLVECFSCSPLRPATGALQQVDIWLLNGVRFADEGWALGRFAYDPTTGEVPWWSLQTFGGDEGKFPPAEYNPLTSFVLQAPLPGILGSFVFRILISSSQRDIKLGPAVPLPANAAAIVFLDLSNTHPGVNNLECFNCSPLRLITSGVLYNPAGSIDVPVVSNTALIALACCLLLTALLKLRAN